ncbi:MAG: peptidylprolyl isomerase [Calditrichaeota bacterium]|nr:peptidylprolyl isomerase [Calditrichota bacterium]MCB0267995.1 peptidylprolyl isomerase [Calditrichota bacterium]MCB0288069.1 peptidylprolyl isomerase [Calditrichota bacterium]MCB0300136.1 peptidylprolyl isomerase [Calditrichota bacterium]MCB9066300.1 peptidylprolyl isomerase [Calditrichia bacterium]
MATAKTGDTVRVHYTGKLIDGSIFDSSVNSEPMEFTIGDGRLIAGFDNAVNGMSIGQTKTINIPSDEAYGPRYDELVQIVDRSDLPEDMEPAIGQRLEAVQENGNVINVIVSQVEADKITIDANHPLAGEDLVFDLELVEIL